MDVLNTVTVPVVDFSYHEVRVDVKVSSEDLPED